MVRFARMFVLFLAALFAVGATGCGNNDPDPDPVAYNSRPEAQQKRLEEYNRSEMAAGKPGAYQAPKASFGDKFDNRINAAKNALSEGAKTAGQLIAIAIFHILMLLIPLLVIFFVPGFAVGDFEMAIEGVILLVVGIVLFGANWIGELGLGGWVAFSMIIPSILLLLVGLSGRKEGWWKILLVLGPPVFMTGLATLRVIDSAMSALVHGSFLAIFVVAVLAYFAVRKDGEDGGHAHA